MLCCIAQDVDAPRQEKTIVFRAVPHEYPSVWREVELLERHTLHDLHAVLQKAFALNDAHLYAFYLNNNPFDRVFDYDGPGALSAKRHAEKTRLSSLPLKVNKRFLYLFDFGDELLHEVRVLRRDEPIPGVAYPRIVAEEGDAPPQYAFRDESNAQEADGLGSETEGATAHGHDVASHCSHDDAESGISAPTREALERMLPDVVRAVRARRARRWSEVDADEDGASCLDEDAVELSDEDDALEIHDPPREPTRDELMHDYQLAIELLRRAEGDLLVLHVVLEHASKENVVGWLFDLPAALSDADLHDPAIELANLLHAAEPDAGMNDSLPALLLRAGRIEAADDALRESLAGDPDNPELLQLKAELEQARGNAEAAIEHYQAALEWTGSELRQRAEIVESLSALLAADGKHSEVALLRRRELELTNSLEPRRALAPNGTTPPNRTTVRREQPKVGRNDPCTCGSGKKYKKCCGQAS